MSNDNIPDFCPGWRKYLEAFRCDVEVQKLTRQLVLAHQDDRAALKLKDVAYRTAAMKRMATCKAKYPSLRWSLPLFRLCYEAVRPRQKYYRLGSPVKYQQYE